MQTLRQTNKYSYNYAKFSDDVRRCLNGLKLINYHYYNNMYLLKNTFWGIRSHFFSVTNEKHTLEIHRYEDCTTELQSKLAQMTSTCEKSVRYNAHLSSSQYKHYFHTT